MAAYFDIISEDGAWDWFLANAAHSITILPEGAPGRVTAKAAPVPTRAEAGLDAGEGRDNPDPLFAPVSLSFHDNGDTHA